MHWFLRQAPAVILTLWGSSVFILAGNKIRFSWMLGVLSEFAWAAYSLWLHQYGLLLGCVFYGIVYGRNWLRWAPDKS